VWWLTGERLFSRGVRCGVLILPPIAYVLYCAPLAVSVDPVVKPASSAERKYDGTPDLLLACFGLIMMKREIIPIADIYVPIKRRATLDQKRVDEIAASILDKGLQAPILVRADGARFVLVEGLHRLEAAKALGEETIAAFLVDARKH
jgi:sulfiredoxin